MALPLFESNRVDAVTALLPMAAFNANATEILASAALAAAMGGTAFLLAFAVRGEAEHCG